MNTEFWLKKTGKQAISPLWQKCFTPPSTLQKVCSHRDQAQQHHGYSRTLWSHLHPTPPMFFFLLWISSLDSLLPHLLPSFSKGEAGFDLSHKWSWHLNKQHNQDNTLTHAQWVMQPCSSNIISLLTHMAQRYTLLVPVEYRVCSMRPV